MRGSTANRVEQAADGVADGRCDELDAGRDAGFAVVVDGHGGGGGSSGGGFDLLDSTVEDGCVGRLYVEVFAFSWCSEG